MRCVVVEINTHSQRLCFPVYQTRVLRESCLHTESQVLTSRDSRVYLFWVSCKRFVRLQVIAPEEIIDPSADEQSVMTYLSQFPKAKLKPGAPLKPKLNPKKARAYGPGTRTNLQHKIKILTLLKTLEFIWLQIQ